MGEKYPLSPATLVENQAIDYSKGTQEKLANIRMFKNTKQKQISYTLILRLTTLFFRKFCPYRL